MRKRRWAEYAAEHANGPGAIFVGDPTQLLGPPPHPGLMFETPEFLYTQIFQMSLFGAPELRLDSHMFIYTSDYYKGLLEKAKLTNPTELTSSGENIEIQHACITRTLPTCVMIQAYWAPNLAERTNGQVKLSVVSFPELGLDGPDTLDQVGDGTLDMANIYAGYVAGALPPLEIQAMWGLFTDWETSYSVLTAVAEDVDQIILEATDGSHVLNRNWFAVPTSGSLGTSRFRLSRTSRMPRLGPTGPRCRTLLTGWEASLYSWVRASRTSLWNCTI